MLGSALLPSTRLGTAEHHMRRLVERYVATLGSDLHAAGHRGPGVTMRVVNTRAMPWVVRCKVGARVIWALGLQFTFDHHNLARLRERR
jgi:hypothetical protein